MLGMAAKRGELPYLVLYNLQPCISLMMFTLASSSMATWKVVLLGDHYEGMGSDTGEVTQACPL